jgi:hypothetical protein
MTLMTDVTHYYKMSVKNWKENTTYKTALKEAWVVTRQVMGICTRFA